MTTVADALEIKWRVEDLLEPMNQWSCRCHEASIRVVKSDILIHSRVARGSCENVAGQHSWVICGHDCYDMDALIIDPTLWSYDSDVTGIWTGTMRNGKHRPHAMGSIWDWGRPDDPTGEIVELDPPEEGWSPEAESFLRLLGPLDEQGWTVIAHAPAEGWPAGEIWTQLSKRFPALIPIDRLGMTTDLNPSGLYLKED